MIGVELWVGLAIIAALGQTTRNALAQSISSRISPALNSWSRFTFCLPFAAATCAVVVSQGGIPQLPASFFGYCLATALTQLLGNVALVSAFRAGGFGESIVLHKLEVLLTAIVGALWFAEIPSLLGALGVAICGVGVLLINLGRDSEKTSLTRAFHLGRAGGLALLCAALLVLASFALKAASAVVADANANIDSGAFAAPIQTLFHTTWIEVVLLSVWIAAREPESIRQIPVHWRRMALIGATGFAASLCWFWAYSLSLVAYVKAVGQIEALLAVALGIRMLGEKSLVRQLPGVLIVTVGIVLVLLG